MTMRDKEETPTAGPHNAAPHIPDRLCTPLFDDFWEASSLDRFNVAEFARSLSSYDSDEKELLLQYPDAPLPLPSPRTRLGHIARRRHTERAFSEAGLSERDLGALLASLRAWNGLEHRSYPSAGATYVTEVYCVGFRAGSITGKIAYYDAERHGLVKVGEAPSWEDAKAAMQQLSLAVAESRRLKGVILGGMLDSDWLRTLGLVGTDARVVVGYLVGK
jgi:hypothetical protein